MGLRGESVGRALSHCGKAFTTEDTEDTETEKTSWESSAELRDFAPELEFEIGKLE
jgi:hypothetical protein